MTAEKRPIGSGESVGELNNVKRMDSSMSKGIAQLKPEFVVCNDVRAVTNTYEEDEPASERMVDDKKPQGRKGRKKNKGQNKNRDLRQVKEVNSLCPKYIQGKDEENLCNFGDSCRFVHDVSLYLATKKPEIQSEFFKECPVYSTLGRCPMGFKCRFLSSHLTKSDDGSVSLLKMDPEESAKLWEANHEVNHIRSDQKLDLIKKRFPFDKSEFVLEIIDAIQQEFRDDTAKEKDNEAASSVQDGDEEKAAQVVQREKDLENQRTRQKEVYMKYKDTRYFSQEKKKLDYRRKKIVSPLTTVGNLPYRRLMRKLGADITYSEMALSVPLIQGTNSEWALPKAHSSEYPGYGVQIACSKPWQAAKAAEALVSNTDRHISEINLNSGCPIDLLYRQGSGSALLDNPARMIRCLNAMNYVSGDIPVTVKLRTGTKDDHPIAETLIKRLVKETDVAAITLHGRSRQQRYTKQADWNYVSKIADHLRSVEQELDMDKPRIQFVGNGDVNNYEDWYRHLDGNENIDSIMVARGALIKPWIFEEIDSMQHLDKSGQERLEILKDYSQFAMEHWGTDEYGLSQCRRYFCEFMSFFHRYLPVGILERVPVQLNERPPNWKGRSDTESLLGSSNVNDWIKLSEMFFGKTDENFVFMPKHKSSSFKN